MSTQLTIILTDEGQIKVEGPIENQIMAYGLLECGKQALMMHYRQISERLIQPVSGTLPPFKPGPGS